MLSAKGSDIVVSSSNMTAVYKGLTVSVYAVDKPEVNLTRRDLVELINVCSSYRLYLFVHGGTDPENFVRWSTATAEFNKQQLMRI